MAETIKTILTADSSELRSEFNKAAAVVDGYQKKQEAGFAAAKAGYQAEMTALRLHADGFKNLADSFRQQIGLRQEAKALAVAANVTEAEALRMLQEKLLLQKNLTAATQAAAAASNAAAARARAIANPRATGLPGGGELAPLTPQSLQQIDRAIASTRELRRQTLLAGKGAMGGSMGFLAFSQAVEDSQYGIRGVLNNIPQMVMGFGGSMGIAGAISLAAVAATVLYPHLKRLYGAMENESVKKAGEEWDRVFKGGMEAASAFEKAATQSREFLDLTAQINQALSARSGIVSVMAKYHDEELAAARSQRDVEKQILDARLALNEAQGGSGAAIRQQIEAAAAAGRAEDLINRQKELARAQAEVLRQGTVRSNLTAETDEAEIAATKQLVEIKRQLAGAEANLAYSKERQKEPNITPAELGEEQRNGQLSQDKADSLKEEIAILEKTSELRTNASRAEIQALTGSINALDEKINKTREESEELTRQIALRKQLAGIEAQTTAANQWAAWQQALDKGKKTAQEANNAAREAGQKLVDENTDRQKNWNTGKADFATEITALRLQLAGHKDKADALRNEMALRRDALALAISTGVTEKEALRMVRAKAALEKQNADEQKTLHRTIPRSKRDTMGFGPSRLEGRGGFLRDNLRNDALRRRGLERAAAANPVDPTIRQLERSVNLQEQMLKVFQKLGIA